jgi:S1-C subfamily serine protease
MDIAVNIALLLLTLITALISIGGETWDKTTRRITKRGYLAIVAFILIFALAAYKEYRSSDERERTKKEVDRNSADLHQLVVTTTKISNREFVDPSEAAKQTLNRLLSVHRSAAAKITAQIGQERREKSGFFFNNSGYLLTADFAVSDLAKKVSAANIVITTIDGRTHSASIVLVSEELAIAVLKINYRNDAHLDLESRAPAVNEEVLVIGSTLTELFTSTVGKIVDLKDIEGDYARERDTLPGFGGGPLIDDDGLVLGLNWGALVPPVAGRARFIRADRIRAYLVAKNIPV